MFHDSLLLLHNAYHFLQHISVIKPVMIRRK